MSKNNQQHQSLRLANHLWVYFFVGGHIFDNRIDFQCTIQWMQSLYALQQQSDELEQCWNWMTWFCLAGMMKPVMRSQRTSAMITSDSEVISDDRRRFSSESALYSKWKSVSSTDSDLICAEKLTFQSSEINADYYWLFLKHFCTALIFCDKEWFFFSSTVIFFELFRNNFYCGNLNWIFSPIGEKRGSSKNQLFNLFTGQSYR